MAFRTTGQGATEYLVLLAVILIIALVAISLLGFFPAMAADAKITQSNTYWRGEAAPIAIMEYAIDSSGNVQLILMNNDALGAVSITNISLFDPSTGDILHTESYSPAYQLSPGAQHEVDLTTDSNLAGTDVYQFNVKITYRSPGGLRKTESGAQPLVGKYSTSTSSTPSAPSDCPTGIISTPSPCTCGTGTCTTGKECSDGACLDACGTSFCDTSEAPTCCDCSEVEDATCDFICAAVDGCADACISC